MYGNDDAHGITVLAMISSEITRSNTLTRPEPGRIQVADAMQLLGLAGQQVYRLLDRPRQDSATGLVSRRRDRPSNRAA